MKKVQFMSVNRPQAELDCCYKVTKQTGEEEQVVKSVVVRNAKRNPNFDDSVDIFDVVCCYSSQGQATIYVKCSNLLEEVWDIDKKTSKSENEVAEFTLSFTCPQVMSLEEDSAQ